ncbi:MAG: DUF2007 domain-containing protein [Steroidobacteraceae bacterium]
MRRVHSAESVLEVAHLRNLLEHEGIECFVLHDRLAGALGEIPFVECWPELWVREDGQERHARRLIERALAPGDRGEPWTCDRCGERIEAQFSECWNCAGAGTAGGAAP